MKQTSSHIFKPLFNISLVLMIVLCSAYSYGQTDSTEVAPVEQTIEATDSISTIPSEVLEDNSETISEGIESEVSTESPDDNNTIEPTNILDVNGITTVFVKEDIELKKGDIISNVLKVYNHSNEVKKFTVDILAPGDWGYLNDLGEVYEVAIGDTLIVPVTLIPNKLFNGNTNIVINAFLLDEDEYQVANNSFTISTTKHVSWNVEVGPSDKLYFKNNEHTKDFSFNISNTGTYKQDIFLDIKTTRGDIVLQDTTQRIVKKTNTTISLDAREDSTFNYNVNIISGNERNRSKISLLSHRPNSNLFYKKYTLFVNSSEPKALGESTYKRGNKVSFIKLPNEIKFSDYGYPSLPLLVEMNSQNLLSDNSFMSLNMRGFYQLNDKASLAYFSQINYSQPYWNKKLLGNTPWYIGYYDDRMSVEAGQISGNIIGMPSFGKGLKASYQYLEKHKTGVFYVRGPGFFKALTNESYGAFHKYTHSEQFSITAKVGRSMNYQSQSTIDVATLQPNFSINRKHFITAIGAVSRGSQSINNTDTTYTGFLAGLSYTTNFLDKKLRFSLGGRYNDSGFSFGSFERLTANHQTSYEINKTWDVILFNTYQRLNGTWKQELLNNSLIFKTVNTLGTFQPGLYFDITDYAYNKIYSRGLSLRYSKQNYRDNFLASAYFKSGYRKSLDIPEAGNYFTLEFSSLVKYQVWSLSAKYNYGALSTSAVRTMINEGITPQSFRTSFQHQYLFKDNHFVIENSLTYNYHNRFRSNSIGLNPEVFYFSNDGWRFSIKGSYNLVANNYNNAYNSLNSNRENEDEVSINDSFSVGVSIKKEFGIPIPFTKKKAASIKMHTFYDLNGNNIKDKGEPGIENVVIRFGGKELISNEKGEAIIKNIPMDIYALNVFSLDKLTGWFPNIEDSLTIMQKGDYYIPFVRGIKVYGDVVLSRQKIAIMEADKIFDLSRIKITASNQDKIYNTLTDIDGRFEFYLPNGDYTITLDPSILTKKYKLSRNNLPVSLENTQDGVYVSFYIIENKRKVVVKEFGSSPEE